MVKKIEPVGVTIDKLTLLGDLEVDYDDFYENIKDLGFVAQDYVSQKLGYSYVFIHPEGGGYLEMAKQKRNYDVQDLIKQKAKLWNTIQSVHKSGINDTGMSLDDLNEKLEGVQEILEQVDERGFLKRLKDIRYELNPKYFTQNDEAKVVFDGIVKMMEQKTISFSSVHIAIDYSIDINSITIEDTAYRKEALFRSQAKKLQSLYLASRSSRNQICIYDKKAEVMDKRKIKEMMKIKLAVNTGEIKDKKPETKEEKEKLKEMKEQIEKIVMDEIVDQYPDEQYVTRFEARLKNNYAREFLTSDFNPFDGIIVTKGLKKAIAFDQDRTMAERAMINLIIDEPSLLMELPETTRRRYKKKIEEVKLTLSEINVSQDFKDKKSSLVSALENWINTI